jgi:hypothetical protein
MTELRHQQSAIPVSRKAFGLSFAAAFAFLYLRTFLLPGTPFAVLDDQTLFFARATHMLQGQAPYRDFFEIVTPGTELLYAAAFRLLGVHAWVMPAWAMVMGLASFGFVTSIAKKVLSGLSVWLPGWLFLVFDFNSGLDMTHHWFSTLAALAAVAVLMDGLSARRIMASSLLCATAVLFTQTAGALVFFAIALYLVFALRSETQERGTGRSLAIFVLPFLLMTGCALGYCIFLSGFHAVYFDLVEYPVKFMTTADVNRPWTYFQQMGKSLHVHGVQQVIFLVSVLVVYALVPYVYLVGLYALWRGRGSIDTRRKIFLLHVVGVALFVSVAHGARHFRLCTVAAPAILVFVWLLHGEGRARRYVRHAVWVLTVFYAILLPVHRQMQWHGTLDLPIGRTAFSDKDEFQMFQEVAQRSHPKEALFNESALNLYLSLENPAGTESVSYDETTRPEQIAALLSAFERRPPAYIVVWPAPGSTPGHAAPFLQYVREHYRLAAVFPLDHTRSRRELWERQ